MISHVSYDYPKQNNCCSGSLLLQKVVPDHFFANVVLDYLFCKFLFQITSLQVVVLDHFFANCCSRSLLCKLFFWITSFAIFCSGSLVLLIVVPNHFFGKLLFWVPSIAIVVPDPFFCKLLFRITSIANCCSRSLLLQIVAPDHFCENQG